MHYIGPHPSHGVGAFIPGFFYMPENPVTAGARGYAHYVPSAAERIGNSYSNPHSAMTHGLALAGACSGGDCSGSGCSGCSGLSGCSCQGGGKVALTAPSCDWDDGYSGWAGLNLGEFPLWANIAIGGVAAAVVLSLLGIRERRRRQS